METTALTFRLLDERIEALLEHPSEQSSLNRRAKWGIALIAIAGTLSLAFGKLLPPRLWAAVLQSILLILEIAGMVLVTSATLPGWKTLTFAQQRREFAEVLDFDLPHHESLFAWLHSFPRERVEAMSEFATYRLGRYRSKMPVLAGSIEKLGALPLLAAIVIQFKDASWPPQPSLWQILLFALLTFFYWLCLLAVSQRLRLELYDMLLKRTLAQVP